MKVRDVRTGQLQTVENPIGRAMIATGAFEEVVRLPQPGDAKPLKPAWAVVLVRGLIGIQLKIGQAEYFYVGLPEQVHNKRDSQGNPYSSVFGRAVPEPVLAAYRRAREKDPDHCAPVPPEWAANVKSQEQIEREADLRRFRERQQSAASANISEGEALSSRLDRL